jgi:tRNA A-37 threonylcarbamoyl transferase component Bud32
VKSPAAILESLSGLHSAGIAHGDARYRNVVQVMVNGIESYRWIDFLGISVPSTMAFEKDIICFLKSMKRTPTPASTTAVKNYALKTATNRWNNDHERITAVRQLWE